MNNRDAGNKGTNTDLPVTQQADKYDFVVWDYIHACEPSTCELAKHDICNYDKEGLCGVEEWYVNAIFAVLAGFAERSGDVLVKQWLGFHVMPLYHQLVKLKKLEWAVSAVGRMEFQTKMGDWKIHPVYREIRDTIRAITMEWKVAGMQDVARELGYLGGAVPDGINDAMMSRKRRKRGDIHAVSKIEGTYRKDER